MSESFQLPAFKTKERERTKHWEEKNSQTKIHSVVVWMKNTFHRFIYSSTWSPVGGADWGHYGAFKRWSLAEAVHH